MVLGDHVTLDAGTGAVHTAPGHGADDYEMGRRYNLPIDNPVGNDGRFVAGTPLFEGLSSGTRTRRSSRRCARRAPSSTSSSISHSYPHCWRHKSPVIFRATPQWFLSMEKAGLRRDALTPSAAWSGFRAGASSASPA